MPHSNQNSLCVAVLAQLQNRPDWYAVKYLRRQIVYFAATHPEEVHVSKTNTHSIYKSQF